MSIHDGVVTTAGDEIPVIVELNETHVRLSAGGAEIGHWPVEECEIAPVTGSTYAITAENETLEFVPTQPSVFAAAVNGGAGGSEPMPPQPEPAPDPPRQAPPPKPLTMGLFYALCLLTAGLAVWSLISIIL